MPEIHISGEQFQEMIEILKRNPQEFFLSPHCRQFLAMSNFHKRGATVRVHEDTAAGVMPGTVEHNRIQIDQGTYASFTRTARLIGPIVALDHIFHSPERFKVLSIGPRTEMELYHLVGAGFHPDNIKALDLISPSPWIDPGDMHAMPYPDRSFDIAISSWTLAYSATPQKAVDEMLRVLVDGGLIAIGATHEPNFEQVDYKDADKKIVGTVFRKVDDLKALLGTHLREVHFQAEPPVGKKGAVMIVARIRH